MTVALAAAASAATFPAKTGFYPTQTQEVGADGSYNYQYETDTGIKANEEGFGGVKAVGGASWTDPEGVPVNIQYTADENGYVATGSHVPVVPAHVGRALEYIRTHPGYVEPTFAKKV